MKRTYPMFSIAYFRRCWYIHQYRKNRNQIIEIKFRIDNLLRLEKVKEQPLVVVRLRSLLERLRIASQVNEQLHQANKSRAARFERKCYRSGFNHRLRSIRNSLKHITENME